MISRSEEAEDRAAAQRPPYVDPNEYWDLGDEHVIRMSDKALANVLRSIITLRGAILDSYVESGYARPNLNPVLFRIRLPHGQRHAFEELSGYKLHTPPRLVGVE